MNPQIGQSFAQERGETMCFIDWPKRVKEIWAAHKRFTEGKFWDLSQLFIFYCSVHLSLFIFSGGQKKGSPGPQQANMLLMYFSCVFPFLVCVMLVVVFASTRDVVFASTRYN